MGVMWPLIFIGNPSLNKACQGLLVKVDESTYYYLCPKGLSSFLSLARLRPVHHCPSSCNL